MSSTALTPAPRDGRGRARAGGGPRVEHDLAGLAGLERGERLLEALERQLVRDQRPDVDDAALEQPARAVPGFEDPPSADRVHLEVLEDQRLGDVDRDRPLRDPEEDDPAAVARDPEGVRDGPARARHLEDDVEAEPLVVLEKPARLVLHGLDVDDRARAHARRQLEPERRSIGSEHDGCARGPRDPDREQADRATAEHGDRAADEILLAGREDRVSERLLQGRDLRRQLGAVVLPDH